MQPVWKDVFPFFVALGTEYLLKGRTSFIPTMTMTKALVAAIVDFEVRLSVPTSIGGFVDYRRLDGNHYSPSDRKAVISGEMKELNKRTEESITQFFSERANCNYLNAEWCDHGVPTLHEKDNCLRFMSAYERRLYGIVYETEPEGMDAMNFIFGSAYILLGHAAQQVSRIPGFLESNGIHYSPSDSNCPLSIKPHLACDLTRCLVKLGTHFILEGIRGQYHRYSGMPFDTLVRGGREGDDRCLQMSFSVACSIQMMETKRVGKGQAGKDLEYDQLMIRKTKDLLEGGPYAWVRFFSKRIS